MKRILLALILILPLGFHVSAKGKDKAQAAYNRGDYETALTLWKKTIARYEKRNKAAQCTVYAKAGETALKLGKTDEARQLLEKAIYSASVTPAAFVALAKIYRQMDNLSLEITTLEKYVKKYPDGKEIVPMRERLFDTYIESENWQDAVNLWERLPENYRSTAVNKAKLLKADIALDHTSAADKLAAEVLAAQPENLTALDYEGKKYFWRAENRYQAEMKAYARNKTRSQYAHLLKAFRVVTVDFKKSLGFFRKLYALQPSSENARYLGNIYARLDNAPKAKYYQHLAGRLKKEGK